MPDTPLRSTCLWLQRDQHTGTNVVLSLLLLHSLPANVWKEEKTTKTMVVATESDSGPSHCPLGVLSDWSILVPMIQNLSVPLFVGRNWNREETYQGRMSGQKGLRPILYQHP